MDEGDDALGSLSSLKRKSAPSYEIPPKKFVAIEHPCIWQNIDNGLKTFGQEPEFHKLFTNPLEPQSIPVWLRYNNPLSKPIIPQYAPSNNALLKITVPKRTGRKRKRGTSGPFLSEEDVAGPPKPTARRRDAPRSILRKMQDNPEQTQADIVGLIEDTYRYRGLADFQFSNVEAPFLNKVADHLLPLKVSKLRDFHLESGVTSKPGQEVIPPPQFTNRVVPFNYEYEQNPNVKTRVDAKGGELMINVQGRHKFSYGWFIPHDAAVIPTEPKKAYPESNPRVDEVIRKLRDAFDERPIWTRRALMNRIHGNFTDAAIKVAVQLVGYQFRGGPWRDAIIRYGIDPRSDPEFRKYQTLSFKLSRNRVGMANVSWQTIRQEQTRSLKTDFQRDFEGHRWDGKTFSSDGKFWQLCDITDPVLNKMIAQAPLRPVCDMEDSGWFYQATWGKVKLFMRAKMVAMHHGRLGSDDDEPQKPGFLYNSYIMECLKNIDDIKDTTNSNVNPLLYPLNDLGLKGTRVQRRPQVGKMFPSTLRDGQSRSGSLPGGDSPAAEAVHGSGSTNAAAARQDPDAVDEVSGGTEGVDEVDNAWAHVVGSDANDSEGGDEDDDQMDEDDDFEEGSGDEEGGLDGEEGQAEDQDDMLDADDDHMQAPGV